MFDASLIHKPVKRNPYRTKRVTLHSSHNLPQGMSGEGFHVARLIGDVDTRGEFRCFSVIVNS